MQFRFVAALLFACGLAMPAHAVMWWTYWSPIYTSGDGGSASGWNLATEVTYTGQLLDLRFDTPSWQPDPTYDVGIHFTPSQGQGMVAMTGGNAMLNTITFSQPIHKPYLTIWSLGQLGLPAAFIFDQMPSDPDAGGPSLEYGGSSITRSGNAIWGEEGNGVIHFEGVYSTISWVSPIYEDFYGFTVGIRYRQECAHIDEGAEQHGDVTNCVTPEPLTASVFGSALIGLAILNRRRRHGS